MVSALHMRRFVADCLRWADQTSNASHREHMLEIAKTWTATASSVERHASNNADAARPDHPRFSLKLVFPPFVGHTIDAPPILNASDHTVDFVCGTCDAVLMHGEHGQVHNVTIHCRACGSYNTTNE
jgi:hypothetical protein